MPLEAGTLVGPYRIVDQVGAGGMGEVYRARDTRLGREIALKILPPERMVEPERRHRFLQEAQAASILNHPGIVSIYDIGSFEGFDYIAMEYVEGQPLDRLIPTGGMRLEAALGIAIPVADALARAHAAGIVHRDLKPGNVIVAPDGRVKLVDFGLAKVAMRFDTDEGDPTRTVQSNSAHTVEGRILGTVSYMSPEQAEGKKVDPRSDIFSFGALLYEMLTGERAFKGESTLSTLSAILTLDPRPIRSLAPSIPVEVERVILRCLKKEPDKRWQNMTDVKVALAELREETIAGLLRPEARPGAARPSSGSKLPFLLGALAALVVVVAAGWMFLPRVLPEAPPAAEEPAAALSASAEETVELNANPAGAERAAPPAGPAASAPARAANPKAAPPPPAAAPTQPVETSAPRPAATPVRAVTLPEGARLIVVLTEEVSALKVNRGDRVPLAVAEDAYIGDQLVVRRGTPVVGVIVESQRRNVFGGGGKLIMSVLSTTAVDGQEIPLRSVPTAAAGDAAAIGMVHDKSVRGEEKRDLIAPAGSTYNAWVGGAREITLSR